MYICNFCAHICIFVTFAHMFVSSTVLRGRWDLNIQPHSPEISLYEPAFCKPEDGLQVGRNMSLFH
jgi:hypothetical protein